MSQQGTVDHEYRYVGGRMRRYTIAPPRPCSFCGREFRPKLQGPSGEVALACSIRCARGAGANTHRRSRAEAVEHFWSQVDRSRGAQACWPWLGYLHHTGYGIAYAGGIVDSASKSQNVRAHRIAFLIANGDVLGLLHVCHSCDNRSCCNPAHLFLGTAKDNMADMVQKDRHARGERNQNAKLTDEVVRLIRSDARDSRALALELGVTPGLVRQVRQGRIWKHVT